MTKEIELPNVKRITITLKESKLLLPNGQGTPPEAELKIEGLDALAAIQILSSVQTNMINNYIQLLAHAQHEQKNPSQNWLKES